AKRANVPWIIVGLHRPLYDIYGCPNGVPEGHNANIQAAFEDLLIKYKVDVVLTGHQHYYERQTPIRNSTAVLEGVSSDFKTYDNPQAPVYILSGAGGSVDVNNATWNAVSNYVDYGISALDSYKHPGTSARGSSAARTDAETALIEPSVARAITYQRNRSSAETLCYVELPATHNIVIARAQGYGNRHQLFKAKLNASSTTSFIRTSNQFLSLPDQLSLGVRLMKLDVHYFASSLRSAHCSELGIAFVDDAAAALLSALGSVVYTSGKDCKTRSHKSRSGRKLALVPTLSTDDRCVEREGRANIVTELAELSRSSLPAMESFSRGNSSLSETWRAYFAFFVPHKTHVGRSRCYW
ncbi:hypothetical protein PF001_g29136, partial [Phytophthora fragariae]